MIKFLSLIVATIKIYIVFKVVYVLFMYTTDPSQYNVNEIIYWSGFMIFDIWITGMIPPISNEKKENDDDDYLEGSLK